MDGEVRAFHNICRHRGNKLVWTDFPREETSGTCRQFACKYHGWRYDLDGALHVRAAGGRVLRPRQGRLRPRPGALRRVGGVHLRQPRPRAEPVADASSSARWSPRSTATRSTSMTERYVLPRGRRQQLEALHRRASRSSTTHPSCTRSSRRTTSTRPMQAPASKRCTTRSTARTGMVTTSGGQRWSMPAEMLKPMEIAHPQRPVRPVGRARPRRRSLPGVNPADSSRGALDSFQFWPELRDPDLGARLVPHVPLLADVATTRTSSRARSTSCPRRTPANGSRTRWPRSRSRSTRCRTATRSRRRS